MSEIDGLKALLDERGEPYVVNDFGVTWQYHSDPHTATESMDGTLIVTGLTPQQAVDATLGRISWSSPTWERWLESLKHADDDIKTIGDAVEQLMYEAIQYGGDMGPNGNVYQGIDEGDVLTSGFINSWIERFESTLGRDKYSYEQWREISDAIGDAMEYAHDKAIEHPDKADPLWNLDEYVNRVLDTAFNGAATLGRGECRVYMLTAVDIGDGRMYTLGLYSTEEKAKAAISENKNGYALHDVQKWVIE